MTKMTKKKYTCAVCGAENEYSVLLSTSSFGSPDLDMRPPRLWRWRMLVQECSSCGYVAKKISDKTKISPDYLKSEKYVSCDGIHFESDMAERFYKYHLLSLRRRNVKEAFWGVVHAAWACDDQKDDENAKKCRTIALSLYSRLPEDENLSVMKMDLLRRSGQFETLIKEYSSAKFSRELLDKIAKFQLKKAAEGDTACYTVADAEENRGDE